MHKQDTLTTVEPGIYYRQNAKGDRVYEIGYTDSMGKRVRHRVEGGLKQAKEERARKTAAKADGKTVVFTTTTFASFAREVIGNRTGIRETSRARMLHDVETDILPVLGIKTRLVDVKRADCIRVVEAAMKRKPRRGKGGETLSGWTVRSILTTLIGVLSEAVERELIGVNPARNLRIRKDVKVSGGNIDPFDDQDVRELIATPGWLGILFETAVITGGRQSELLALRWPDFAEGRITFSRQALRDGTVLEQLKGKAPGESRPVLIDENLAKRLREWRIACLDKDGWIFPSTKRPGEPFSHRMAYMGLQRVCKRQGIKARSFHNLRHTCASMLIEGNATVKQVQEHLGHATPSITLDTYTHQWRQAASPEKMLAAFAYFREAVS